MLLIDHQPPKASRSSRYGAFLIVVLLHILIVLWIALERAGVFPPMLPPIEVQLIPGGGGGQQSETAEVAPARAASPSSVHAPEDPEPHPDPLVAPPEPAPQVLVPELNPGVPDAPAIRPASAQTLDGSGAQAGQGGGTGAGVGTGAGDGVGPGSARDGGAQWVRQLTPAERDAHYPREAARRALPGVVVLNCTVFASTRIERCRVVSETPRREGFGAAALQGVRLMRMRPPVVDGRVLRAHRMNITIHFTPPVQTGSPPTTR